MHRFLVHGDIQIGASAELPPDEARHAMQVLRLAEGTQVVLLDGMGGLFRATLSQVLKAGVRADVVEALPSTEPRARITLYQGVAKGEKMDWIIQKSVELGVARIQPVLFSRCVAQGRQKNERWQRIALEAAKQCGRGFIPEIADPVPFDAVQALLSSHGQCLVPWEDAEDTGLSTSLDTAEADIGVVIGPEGGIDEREVACMKAWGAKPITLGARILRTETAAIAALTMVLYAMGDMGCRP